MSATGRAAIRSIVALQWDGGDAQGSILAPAFGLASVLHVYRHAVPDEAGFHPGIGLDTPDALEDWPDVEFAAMYRAGEIDADDMDYWIRVLARAIDLLPVDRRY